MQCYFKNREDDTIDPEVLDTSKKIRDEIEQKVIHKLDHSELTMGDQTADLDQLITKETEKYLKALEKTLQNDPEYEEIQNFIKEHPDQKIQYLKTIGLKYSQVAPLPKEVLEDLNGYNSFTTKHKERGGRGWSEVKSNPARGSHYSNSVRHSRYKAMGLDEMSKKEFFQNLRVIKKLQNEKKKREKVIEYLDQKHVLKQQAEEAKKVEEQERREQDKQKELQEWKEK